MQNPRLTYLFYRQMAKVATILEKKELILLMQLPENKEQLRQLMDEAWDEFEPASGAFEKDRSESLLQAILFKNRNSVTIHSPAKVYSIKKQQFKWIGVAAAAIVILVLNSTFHFLSQNQGKQIVQAKRVIQNSNITSLTQDVAPGGNKAVLILGDGSRVVLDSTGNGSLALQGNVKILKLKNGELAYNVSGSPIREIIYNTVATPKGGQYKIVLSDGTAVWLNAASSIKYPTEFTGTERKVEITGEAYFEVARLARSDGRGRVPFIVKVNTPLGDGGSIEVLGTHFNVNAYPDELFIKTTLIEGSVKYTKGASTALLMPGQQSRLNKSGVIDLVKNADLSEVTAWKNGKFQFSDASLESVMRELVRWYNVPVHYEGKLPTQRFGGEVSRSSKLSEVLKILEYSGVRFRISDNKIIVGP